MKEIRVVGLILLMLLMTIALFSQETEPLAVTVKTVGSVLKKDQTMQDFQEALSPGNVLNTGDAVKTESAAFAALMYTDDKSLIKIKENSVLELMDTPSTRTINLQYGTIKADVNKQEQREYRIETPTSVASVKGTSFWAVCIGSAGDRFYGVNGVVQVFNFVSGVSVTLSQGQMVISSPDGQIITMPATPDEVPQDVEENVEEPSPEAPQEETPPEEGGAGEESVTPPETGTEPVIPETSMGETPPEEPPAVGGESGEGRNWGMGLGLGSVTIDGKIYNQIALRPEIKLGKLGVGLDVVLYLDDKGNIRTQEWDEFSDYLDKIYYVRWAQPGDPFFVKVGALDNVTLGYGILINGYSNTTEYPQVRKIGVHTGMQFKKLGWEAFMANAKEITGPGLFGGRVTYKPLEAIPVTFGASFIMDGNQYKGLKDTDGDNVPDAFDAFPEEKFTLPDYYYPGAFGYNPGDELKGKKFALDSDSDGIPDSLDYDRDGDGLTDHYTVDPTKNFDDNVSLNPEPFNTEKISKTVGAIGFDVGYPALNMKFFKLMVYGQAASFLPIEVTDYNTGEKFTPGWGIAAPGLKMNIFKIVNVGLEYRLAGENFLYSFWDRAYDFERVAIRTKTDGSLWAYTKDEMKLYTESMQGVFGSADVNILNYIILGSSYQHMITPTTELKSFMATASIPAGKIPKLAEATAFYLRNNDENPFDFKHPSENTILGYRLGFETGGGVVISYVYQKTYRDLDGNGIIDPDTEAITLTTIETGFNF